MHQSTVWFIAIAFLWTGFLVLEGFDFGVGALSGHLGHTRAKRQAILSTIGPVWDGNEVWLITAVAATFAAFPDWYATMLSGFYLPLLAIIVALILRGVGLELRNKRDDDTWKARWDATITASSLLPPVAWGILFANITCGIPIGADKEYAGTLGDLLHPYALLGGALTLALCLTHGATFLALKTTGDIRQRARRSAGRLAIATLILAGVYLTWTVTIRATTASTLLTALVIIALAATLIATLAGREGWAFIGTTTAIAALTSATFTAIYPAVLPSSLDPQWSLTIHNAASSPYTLTIMSWVSVILLPIVMCYQAWTYWVFRQRISAPTP